MKNINTIDEYKKQITLNNIYLVFKHSNKCEVSKVVYKRLQDALDNKTLNISIFMLVVQDSRELSDFIEKETKIKHETPQIILFKDGKVIYTESHYKILSEIVASYVS